MTHRASAIIEIEVLARHFPEMPANEFQRTNVDVTVLRTLKGSVAQSITLDIPGGSRGNLVYRVPDSAEFVVGERALVFVKEPVPGHYMVQDLGLGKFNLVSRGGKTFVESSVCPHAFQGGDEAENLLTKSIPYDDFCALVSAYATDKQPSVSPLKLALALQKSSCRCCAANPMCPRDSEAQSKTLTATIRRNLNVGLCAVFAVLASILVVFLRRLKRKNAERYSAKAIAMVICLALPAGASLAGGLASNYVASGPVWNLDDTNNPAKVSGGRIIWKQSNQVSRTYSGCMTDVQSSFDKWATVSNSRLAFTNAGTTANTSQSGSDGTNFVAWTPTPSNDFSPVTLAITYTTFSVGGPSYFHDCDTIINDRDFTWGPGGQNVNSVSLHEIGHFVGLAHINDLNAVMFPIDQGLTALSSGEILAAQTLYPFVPGSTPPPPAPVPPSAIASASPTWGPAPFNSGFDASASKPGDSPIASYQWSFGDGTSGIDARCEHLYATAGTYTAILTVTDTVGLSSTATQTIRVSAGGQLRHAKLKLNLSAASMDTLSLSLYSRDVEQLNAADAVAGTFNFSGASFNFSFDPITLKGTGVGLNVIVSRKRGSVSITIKNADLQTALAAAGIDTSVSGDVQIPVGITLGTGQLSIRSVMKLSIISKKGVSAQGHF